MFIANLEGTRASGFRVSGFGLKGARSRENFEHGREKKYNSLLLCAGFYSDWADLFLCHIFY